MSFPYTLIFIAILSSQVMSILPSDLVFTPYANFPSKNQTELGYQLTYYTTSGKTGDKGVYFQHSFSKNIRYGAEFYESNNTQRIYHHFSYRLLSLFKNSKYHINSAGSFNYLSNDPIEKNKKQISDGSITLSLEPHNTNLKFHYTFSRKKFSQRIISIGAISYHQPWGIMALEWNGDFLNLSSQVSINNRLLFRTGVTKKL